MSPEGYKLTQEVIDFYAKSIALEVSVFETRQNISFYSEFSSHNNGALTLLFRHETQEMPRIHKYFYN